MKRVPLVLLAVPALLLLSSVLHAEEEKPSLSWTQQLRTVLEGCDHIRVRHGNRIQNRDADALFEVVGTAAVSAIVAGIEVDDARSGGECECMGHPRLDFYRKGKRLVELSFHHGLSFRWRAGPWLGDAQLLPESQLFVSRWLAHNGVPRPLKQLIRKRQRESVLKKRESRYRAILPMATWDALQTAGLRKSVGRALEQTVAKPGTRLQLLLRLYGCHAGNWTHVSGWDRELQDLLEHASNEAYARILSDPGDDPDLLDGLARTFFHDFEANVLRGALEKGLLRVGRAGVTNPRTGNRRRSMAAIARLGTAPAALALLRQVLAGTLGPRTLLEAWKIDPRGSVFSRRLASEVREPESDRVAAAWLLASLGDEPSRAPIRKLAAEVKRPKDVAVMLRAIEVMGK